MTGGRNFPLAITQFFELDCKITQKFGIYQKENFMAKKEDQAIHKLLKDVFGFDQFKGNQEEIIKSILGGNNTFVLMPTGGGKSLCYQLPALMSDGTAIVVSPLIALMKNQVDMIRNFGTELGIAHVMNSSLSKAELMEVKEDLKSGKTKLLYVAPESLTKDETVDFLRGLKISFVAIDEAHCISEYCSMLGYISHLAVVLGGKEYQHRSHALAASLTNMGQHLRKQSIRKCKTLIEQLDKVVQITFNRLFYKR